MLGNANAWLRRSNGRRAAPRQGSRYNKFTWPVRLDTALEARLLVAAVIRDYGMSERREQVPADSRAVHDVEV